MVHNNHLFLRVGPLALRLWKVSVPHTEGAPFAFVIKEAEWEMYLLDQRRVGKRQPRIIPTPWWVKARGARPHMYIVYNRHTGAEFDRYDTLSEATHKITTLDALEDIDTYTWRHEP